MMIRNESIGGIRLYCRLVHSRIMVYMALPAIYIRPFPFSFPFIAFIVYKIIYEVAQLRGSNRKLDSF